MRLSPVDGRDSTRGPDGASPEGKCHPASVVLDRLAVAGAIESIRRQVCKNFYLREMRDPELKVRTHRRAYVLPGQIAMYMARQLTQASLHEIGREFGGRHHTTVPHSINQIEELRRSDRALNTTTTRLMSSGSKSGPIIENY
jgi:chromosomal replication initiation ATPase DnaA